MLEPKARLLVLKSRFRLGSTIKYEIIRYLPCFIEIDIGLRCSELSSIAAGVSLDYMV